MESVDQMSLYPDDGGAVPTPPPVMRIKSFVVRPIEWETLAVFLREFHYRKDWIGGSIKATLGLFSPEIMLGGGNAR